MSLIDRLLKRGGDKEKDVRAGGATDPGKKRDNNEDYFKIAPERGLYVVADGMGGHQAGEVASQTAVDLVYDHFSENLLTELEADRARIETEMTQVVINASLRIQDMGQRDPAKRGMGCTIVVGILFGSTLHVSHVGDSRLYVCDPREIKLITEDHSVVMQLVKAGQLSMEEARHHHMKNQLTQAIGSAGDVKPAYNEIELKSGQRVIICSDGLWDMISDEEIHAGAMDGDDPDLISARLIDLANQAGGHDNVTVVTIIMP